MLYNDFIEGLLDLVLPRFPGCPLCGNLNKQGELCSVCRDLLQSYQREPTCSWCGRFLLPYSGAPKGFSDICPECYAGGGWPFTAARAVGVYEGVLREAVQRLKYSNARWLAGSLAGLIAEVFRKEACCRDAQIILPVPLTGKKLKQRGYNQSELLARELSRVIKLPVMSRVLIKIMDTPAQAGLSRVEREENLIGAFQLARPEAVKGKSILLVDDVFTTGSTLAAVARALKAGGVREVVGLTLAAGRYK